MRRIASRVKWNHDSTSAHWFLISCVKRFCSSWCLNNCISVSYKIVSWVSDCCVCRWLLLSLWLWLLLCWILSVLFVFYQVEIKKKGILWGKNNHAYLAGPLSTEIDWSDVVCIWKNSHVELQWLFTLYRINKWWNVGEMTTYDYIIL